MQRDRKIYEGNKNDYTVCIHSSLISQEGCGTFKTTPFTPKSNLHIFPLACIVIYPFKLLGCELPSFEYISCRNACLPLNRIKMDGT